MLIKPITWRDAPNASDNYIELLGYTNNHKKIYLNIIWEPKNIIRIPDINILKSVPDVEISEWNSNIIRTSSLVTGELIPSPFDPIQNFWAENNIGSYTWLEIKNYSPIFDGYGDLNLQVDASDLVETDYEGTIPLHLAFYYLSDDNKELALITIHGNEIMRYIITMKSDSFIKNPDLIVISVRTEFELNKHFVTLYNNFKPDWLIYYKNRITLDKSLKFMDAEVIDLKAYYDRFYLKNQIVPVENVYQTVSNIMDVFNKDQIQNAIILVANSLGISIKTILFDPLEEIIGRAKYHIDFGTITDPIQLETSKNLKIPKAGIYKNIFEYDYTELYRVLMLNTNDELIVELAERLEDCPSSFITTAFYSCEVPSTNCYLQALKLSENVISIDPMLIRSKIPLKYSWIAGINNYLGYLVIDQTNTIKFKDSELIITGTQPSSEFLRDTIYQYCKSLFQKTNYSIPKIETIPSYKFKDSNNYIITLKGPIQNLSPDDIIDYSYYQNVIDTYLKELKQLKWLV